jgi:hypothetical protein
MRQISIEQLTGLIGVHEPPCISLYQPTHRRHPENQQDPIRYRNLLVEIETSLREKYPTTSTRRAQNAGSAEQPTSLKPPSLARWRRSWWKRTGSFPASSIDLPEQSVQLIPRIGMSTTCLMISPSWCLPRAAKSLSFQGHECRQLRGSPRFIDLRVDGRESN